MNICNTDKINKKMGKMMIEETAIVTEVRQNYAEIVPCSDQSACNSCQSSSGCHSLKDFFSFLAPTIKKQEPTIKKQALRVKNPIYAKRGDRVIVGVKADALLTGSIMMYFVPLVFLLVGALAGTILFSWLGLSAELGSILTGLFSFILSILVIRSTLKMPLIEQRLEAVIIRVAH